MSFIALLLYFFCTFIRPQDWILVFMQTRPIEILGYTTLVLLGLEHMAFKKTTYARGPQNILMLGFYFSILMSHIVHTYFEGMVLSFQSFLVNFIFFYLVLNAINTEKKFKISIWFIVGLIVILVPQGIYQLKNMYGWAGQELTFDVTRNEYRINWIGIFNDPNDLALIFVVAIGLLLPFAFGKKINPLTRVLVIGLIAALFYGIYLTNSRGGLLALMVTTYFFFVRLTRKFVLGGVIGAILAAAILALGPSRAGLISVQEESAFNRVELWYEGMLMLKSNPFFGVGQNMFMEELPQTTHNSFMQIAAELGFIGLFFWVALIYSSYKGLTIVQNNVPRLRPYAIGLQSSLIGFCAAAFFLSRAYVILPYLLFAFSGALLWIAYQTNKDLDIKFTKKDALISFLLSLGVLLMTYIIIKIGL